MTDDLLLEDIESILTTPCTTGKEGFFEAMAEGAGSRDLDDWRL